MKTLESLLDVDITKADRSVSIPILVPLVANLMSNTYSNPQRIAERIDKDPDQYINISKRNTLTLNRLNQVSPDLHVELFWGKNKEIGKEICNYAKILDIQNTRNVKYVIRENEGGKDIPERIMTYGNDEFAIYTSCKNLHIDKSNDLTSSLHTHIDFAVSPLPFKLKDIKITAGYVYISLHHLNYDVLKELKNIRFNKLTNAEIEIFNVTNFLETEIKKYFDEDWSTDRGDVLLKSNGKAAPGFMKLFPRSTERVVFKYSSWNFKSYYVFTRKPFNQFHTPTKDGWYCIRMQYR